MNWSAIYVDDSFLNLQPICIPILQDWYLLTSGLKCRSSVRQRRNPKETADLTSIQELISDIDSNCHSGEIVT